MFDFKGTINVVTELDLAMKCSQTCKVVCIGEFTKNDPRYYNFIEYSVLLPPFPALDAEINGDMNKYNSIYSEYLDMNYDSIMSIIVAAYCGTNVIMYIEESQELHHLQFLKMYFLSKFGLVLGDKEHLFGMVPDYVPYVSLMLYTFMDGFIPLEDVLLAVPNIAYIKNNPIKDAVLSKVANENKFVMSEIDILSWLEQYKYRLETVINSFRGVTSLIKKVEKE